MKRSIKPIVLILFCPFFLYGQQDQYTYKREVKGVAHEWNKIMIPDELYGKTSHNLTDIRIFGITANHDTIEAPYILQMTASEIPNNEVHFKAINSVHDEKGHYFTFELNEKELTNQIELDIGQQNFDWTLSLEGSNDDQKWYTIAEDYRILSIKNNLADFQFTTLSFPETNYRFLRICIHSKEKPLLNGIRITRQKKTDYPLKNYSVTQIKTIENQQAKQTEIEVKLPLAVPVNQLNIHVSQLYDYYRPVTINYVSDSVKTKKGWQYIYNTLVHGTLSSLKDNTFHSHASVITNRLKILIHNQDNHPLAITTIDVQGYENSLVTRLTEEAVYYLFYGNSNAVAPNYDLVQFQNKIPVTIPTAKLGEEQVIQQVEVPTIQPLFSNKKWLWALMILIILILGWFSLKMIQKK